ncbi:genetic competence negative regulator [Litchfieldia salsa]|uniref:Adapter protein MecA n=1 Tax=Litchfieldia salsa TaxID=930152 RepID=A0A1H0WFI7_9BACI|nr:genetic competence negative regulator [Litchfieldia salsa]SDP89539.1 adapter protein MecA 1/2 [Litchfieldia salsa]
MRLERLNHNKIKIFLTFDDLIERGLTKEDLWHDSIKVHQLFRDMIEEASEELGFEANGAIAVEVYSLQAQGMVVIVTKDVESQDHDDEDDDFSDDYIEMQVTLDESDDLFYEFHTFEDVIQLSSRLVPLNILSGKLYSYNHHFYLLFEEDDIPDSEVLISILAEFGNSSTITKYKVHEYGKMLISERSIEDIYRYFLKR